MGIEGTIYRAAVSMTLKKIGSVHRQALGAIKDEYVRDHAVSDLEKLTELR